MGDAECFINTSYFWHDTEVQIKITGDFFIPNLNQFVTDQTLVKNQVSLKRLLTQKGLQPSFK